MTDEPPSATEPSPENTTSQLVETIMRGECAAFIGSGTSIPIGYPRLSELLQQLAIEAGVPELQEKGITDTWMQDFQALRDSLGLERYRGCLLHQFDHRARGSDFSSVLLHILGTPFCAFVTTNYDQCLEFAARDSSTQFERNSFAYPNLPATKLRGGHIFHPHGYIQPEIPDTVRSVILTSQDYVDAYETTGATSGFIRTLFSELDVLFVGFGWEDFVLLGAIAEAFSARATMETLAAERDLPIAREKRRFALVDTDTLERDNRGHGYLRRLGVIPISYDKGVAHGPLNSIVRELRVDSTGVAFPPTPSLPPGFLDPGD